LAFSPDDRFLAGADRILGEICFWDLEFRRVARIIQGPAVDIVSLLFSDDGSQLATSHEDHVVRIWDIDTARQLREIRLQQSDPPGFVYLQPPWKSGQLWVGVRDGTLRRLDTNTGVELQRFDRRELLWSNGGVFAVAPNEEFLATGGRDGIIHQIDARTGADLATMSSQSSSIKCLAFAPTAPRLASSDSRGQVVVWDLIQHQPSAILKGHGGEVRNIVYSVDGKRLCTSGDDTKLNIWNTDPSPTQRDVCRHRMNGLISLAISPDGRKMAAGAMGITGPRVSLWDVRTGELEHEFSEPGDWVWCVVFSPDGNELAAVALTGELCVWDLATYARRYLKQTGVRDLWWVHYSHDGSQIVTGQRHGGLFFHDRRSGAVLRTANIERSRLWIPGFSPNGHTLAVGVDEGLALLDFPSGNVIQTIACESSSINEATFSDDGQRLAYCSGKRVHLFDIDGRPLGVLEHQSTVRSADFSPDGKTLATSDMANQVHVWDVERREERARLRGHDQWVANVRFTPDGKTIVSASNDGTVRLWRSTKRK
jgi:WD40 repeat protein